MQKKKKKKQAWLHKTVTHALGGSESSLDCQNRLNTELLEGEMKKTPNILFWPPWVDQHVHLNIHVHAQHTYMCTHTHINTHLCTTSPVLELLILVALPVNLPSSSLSVLNLGRS